MRKLEEIYISGEFLKQNKLKQKLVSFKNFLSKKDVFRMCKSRCQATSHIPQFTLHDPEDQPPLGFRSSFMLYSVFPVLQSVP